MAKPDPAIYHHVLKELGTEPEETIFIDDKRVNIEAALRAGDEGSAVYNVAQLRADLLSMG